MIHAQQQLCYSKIMHLIRQRGKKGYIRRKKKEAMLKGSHGSPNTQVVFYIFVCNSPH